MITGSGETYLVRIVDRLAHLPSVHHFFTSYSGTWRTCRMKHVDFFSTHLHKCHYSNPPRSRCLDAHCQKKKGSYRVCFVRDSFSSVNKRRCGGSQSHGKTKTLNYQNLAIGKAEVQKQASRRDLRFESCELVINPPKSLPSTLLGFPTVLVLGY